ncbi:MAG TPA: hypothetical protein VFA69_01125 [Candidatus Nitrosotalea sp.]|nr:hypothetical protein [Candidatus Nitrosotalea sp.]
MKHRILEFIHWGVVIFLISSVLVFVMEVGPLLNPDDIVIKDNHILFCENSNCVKLGEKIYWTFVEIFAVEIVVGALALVAIREEISLEKRTKDHNL